MIFCRQVTLVQGEVFATDDEMIEVSTVLGSCVSMCLFDPVFRVGGMNHFLLSGETSHDPRQTKYGLFAFECLFNELLKFGAIRENVKCKIFGGAQMKGSFSDLGSQNAKFAMELLSEEGIECVAHDIGGNCARRIKFHPVSGQVRMSVVPEYIEPRDVHAIRKAPENSGVESF